MRTLPGALIVSSGEKGRDMLCGVLTEMGAGDISTVTSGAEARRGFADADWQVILINTPLSDEFGHELAVFAAGSTGAGVVLLVKALSEKPMRWENFMPAVVAFLLSGLIRWIF